MMYEVITPFRDKFIYGKVYQKGDEFESNDEERIKDLLDRKLIKRVDNDTSSATDVADSNAYNLMTKNEIMELLKQKGIEFNSRQTKDELIQLLGGE